MPELEGITPGVTPASPAEPTPAATPAAPAAPGDTTPQANPEGQPSASEGVKTPESEDKHVPYERFKEVNDKAKQAAEELEKTQKQLAELQSGKTPEPGEEEPQIDPEAQKLLDAYLKGKGFVTQDELRTKELQLQADADVKELQREFTDFDKEKVLSFAEENGLLINNKAGLKAAYNLMKSSDPGAEEALRNKIIAELKESGQLTGPYAEKPGPGGAHITPGEKPKGTRGILHAAIQKHRAA